MIFNLILLKTVTNGFIKIPVSTVYSPSAPFVLKNVEGLGPTDVDINLGVNVTEGGYFQGRRSNSRRIVMTIGLQPDYTTGQTVESLRTTLYGTTAYRKDRTLQFQITNAVDPNNPTVPELYAAAVVDCYVSKLEPNPFSKDPEIVLTLECPSPYLTVVNSTKRIFANLTVSAATSPTYTSVTNIGSAETGVEFNGLTNSTGTYVGLVNYNYESSVYNEIIRANVPLLSGDSIRLSTIFGKKEFYISNSGGRVGLLNLLPYIVAGNNTFFSLAPGVSQVALISDATFTGTPTIGFQPRYLGV